jgi:glycosyltransferase involved in cell wall biosynthesis
MKNLVSIIVPVFNTEQYLRRCIESLINQTYKEIEIILVDDCSVDNSLSICKNFKKIYSNIKIYQHKSNMGLEKTRNDGLDLAEGEWIMFLDSDDTFSLDAVKTMVTFASTYQVDMAFASYRVISNKTIKIESGTLEEGIYSRTEFIKMCLVNIPWQVMSCVGSKIYKKRHIDSNKLRFDKFYKYNEDGAFMLKAMSCAERIGYINIPFYNYYIRDNGSIQSSYRADMYELIHRTNDLMKNILYKNKECLNIHQCFLLEKEAALELNSLENEARYCGLKKYKTVFFEIRKTSYFNEIKNSKNGYSKAERIMIFCLSNNFCFIFYLLLKISIIRKDIKLNKWKKNI